MQFVFLPLLHFGALLVYIVLASLIIFQGPRVLLNRMVALFLLSLGLWSFSNLMVQNPGTNFEAVNIWNNFGALGWISFSAFFLSFVLIMVDKKPIISRWWYVSTVFLPIPVFLLLQLQGYLLVGYQAMYYGWTYHWSETLWPLIFYSYYLLLISLGLYLLARFYQRSASPFKRQQARIMLVTGAISLTIGTMTNVLSQQLKIDAVPPLANVAAVVWAFGVVFAIAKYRFLGISIHTASQHIVDTISDALILADKGGHIVAVNPAAEKMLGYSADELRGRALSVIAGEMRLAERIVGSANTGENFRDYFTSLGTKGKNKVPVMLSTSVLLDKQGRLTGIVCAAKNVTELKRAEKELHERAAILERNVSEMDRSARSLKQAYVEMSRLKDELEEEKEKVEAIIANLVDPILVVGRDSRLKLVNPAAESILKISRLDLGKKVDSGNNYAIGNFSVFINAHFEFKDLDPNDGQKAEEVIVRGQNGKESIFMVLTVPIIGAQGDYAGIMKIFKDLTREKNINKLKSEFISIAAHQLRTPLSAIKWAMRMVLDGDAGALSDDQKMILTKGYLSNERVISLINDMLNVSQIEEGRFGYKYVQSDLALVINELVEDLGPLIRGKKISFQYDRRLDAAPVSLDTDKIRLAMRNLLDNALKYTPENGQVCLTLVQEGREVLVKIKDNGIGIPLAEQDKLFSKFYRARNALQAETDGSGLGLFIVKNIIEEHGGRISFNSEEGRGTEFSVYLPLRRQGDDLHKDDMIV